ncbi:MAG: Fpg/Nei family DNA glycosylase [Acidobacteria bacterium]|nr:Fpg/Nei family DNA glycosylase [Acidobacteriota bacterium]
MPELPEVETYRRYFNRYAAGKILRGVEVADAKSFPGMSRAAVERRLVGARFAKATRRGKYLIAPLEDKASGCVVIHFGMTGWLQFSSSSIRRPLYSRVSFVFDGGRLHYADARRLGKVWWVADLAKFARIQSLGPDALLEVESAETLSQILGRSSQPIKQALMNQKRLAGIGNLYADEILFQSRVHPRRLPASLKAQEWKRLFGRMEGVLRQAVRLGANIDCYPNSWLLPHRRAQGRCPRCGVLLQTMRLAQRTGYHCPRCQRLTTDH